jgi:hypothetical protein
MIDRNELQRLDSALSPSTLDLHVISQPLKRNLYQFENLASRDPFARDMAAVASVNCLAEICASVRMRPISQSEGCSANSVSTSRTNRSPQRQGRPGVTITNIAATVWSGAMLYRGSDAATGIRLVCIMHKPDHAYSVGDHFMVLARGVVDLDPRRRNLAWRA